MPLLADAAPLAPYTTLGLGGPAEHLVTVTTRDELVAAVSGEEREAPLLLAGGSNVVIADEGVPGTVLLVRSSGLSVRAAGDLRYVTVQAGHPFDELVAWSVAEGLSGLESLSGIPGSVGATPIQNVGAYGVEVSRLVSRVHVWDRETASVESLTAAECGFAYRHSVMRHSSRRVVLAVEFALRHDRLGLPVEYSELAGALGLAPGGRAPLEDVRSAVLGLRRRKGMVIDPADPDSRSVGSFFTNPILAPDEWRSLLSRSEHEPPHWAVEPEGVKVSAAWLIEHAGFTRGYRGDGVHISTKHTLALVNDGGTTESLLALAREIRAGVRERFGVVLAAEPIGVGVEL